MKLFSVIGVGLGVALLGLSVFWTLIFPASSAWTDEKLAQKDEIGVQVRNLAAELYAAQTNSGQYRGRSAQQIEAEYKKAKDSLAVLQDEFMGIRDSPQSTASIFRWTGVVCVAIGAFAMMASRNG